MSRLICNIIPSYCSVVLYVFPFCLFLTTTLWVVVVCSVSLYIFFFFFSSRRRHTRYWRDWSSDVCSSDLGDRVDRLVGELQRLLDVGELAGLLFEEQAHRGVGQECLAVLVVEVGELLADRSEERRVGKECRSRGTTDQ